ncbi:Asp-tRNA(Asn)/Glu-tRNA(Gln) amidotransferase subunit GatB [Candidatus Woesearchaeota archaeon]|nr:Asp-tRNA(Asn)/Glu-tRNA(Gln) amidotransferase subunit GatB [Candidatus Woesearchaeota archaeon]MBW3013691.1 Asp-tRNA(Asn)/Glu-tRNA(Gln) amidotransferase subunit GatB [Candidatus Woesearchaeota archaeon]
MAVEVKIGLEIHGYLKMNESKKKLFCDCDIGGEKPNTKICPVCTGQPGNKPMLPNEEAVKKIVACGLMLGCKINNRLLFQRKHYSYPDLPNGYQKTISGAYSHPVGVEGEYLGIGIEEVHLEEDPARYDPDTGKVDYNRCGYPLIEIVTKPDFTSPDQVRDWLKSMLRTLGYVNAIDAEAGIKSDVNVSIGPKFIRAEIKNVNSIKSIIAAIEYEIERQQEEKPTAMETRAWVDDKGVTKHMRKKETVSQYMFIPEPDLPVIELDDDYINNIASDLPERPEAKIEKFTKQGIPVDDATIISAEVELAHLFEKVSEEIDPILAAKWLRRELLRVLNYNEKTLSEVKLDERYLVELLKLIEDNKITDKTGQKLMEMLIEKPFSPKKYVEAHDLMQVTETKDLEKWCKEAIKENPKAVEDYAKGEEKALNFIVGSVMRKSKGKANPAEVTKILKKLLK